MQSVEDWMREKNTTTKKKTDEKTTEAKKWILCCLLSLCMKRVKFICPYDFHHAVERHTIRTTHHRKWPDITRSHAHIARTLSHHQTSHGSTTTTTNTQNTRTQAIETFCFRSPKWALVSFTLLHSNALELQNPFEYSNEHFFYVEIEKSEQKRNSRKIKIL